MPDLFRAPTVPTVVDPDAAWLNRITNAPADEEPECGRNCLKCGNPVDHNRGSGINLCTTCDNRRSRRKKQRRLARLTRATDAINRLGHYANTLDPGPYRDGVTDTLAALCDALED